MASFNTVAGCVLASALFAMVVGKVSNALVHPHKLDKPALAVSDEAPQTAAAAAPAQELPPIGPKLAGANVEAGKAIFQKQCFTCHTVDKGGANKVGPNLWDVVGRKKASHAGFSLLLGPAGQGRRLDLRRHRPHDLQADGLREGHQDGLRRSAQGAGARRRDRLPAHHGRFAQAAALRPQADDMAGSVPAELVALAQRLADAARPIANRYFRTAVTVDDKTDASPVTIADREAETAMRALLTEHVPQHGVFGEEHGAVRTDADYVWVLDPIDGTKAFITGLPIFGTLIALLHRGKPVLGVIDQPILKERWLGVAGERSTFNGQPIQVRACPDLDRMPTCIRPRRSCFPASGRSPRGADPAGEALPLGRRLLRLRSAGLGPCRPGGREFA